MKELERDWAHQGYTVIHGAVPKHHNYQALYQAFDRLVETLQLDSGAGALSDLSSQGWSEDLIKAAYYSRAPMGFRDRTQRFDKMKKIYFQYTREFGEFVRTSFPLLAGMPEFEALTRELDYLWHLSAGALSGTIEEMTKSHSGLSTVLMRKDRPAPVLLRLIRYEPGTEFGTTPHIDKSALTLHLNSDDPSNDHFVIGPPQKSKIRIGDLKPVQATDADRSGNAPVVVFPGMFLSELGYNIEASPHAALGMKIAEYRHSLVAFWLVPSLYSDHLQTSLPFDNAA